MHKPDARFGSVPQVARFLLLQLWLTGLYSLAVMMGDSMRSMRKRGRFDGISKLTENEGLKQKGFMGLNQRIRRSPINMMSFYQARSLSKVQFILVVVTEIFMRSMSQPAT